MKYRINIWIIMAALLISYAGSTQNQVFLEDFESGIPGSIKIIDNDTLTPMPPGGGDNYNILFDDAWVWTFNPQNFLDTVVASTNWSIYDTVGAYNGDWSDDWMIIGPIEVGENPFLRWDALTYDHTQAAMKYEVRVMKDIDGDTTTDFTDLPVAVFDPDTSFAEWTTNNIFLKDFGYNNDTIYLAFRQNTVANLLGSVGGDVIYLDDIEVYELPSLDLELASASIPAYTEVGKGYNIWGLINNNGWDTTKSVDISWSVNGAAAITQSYTGLSEPYNTSFAYTHDSSWTPADSGTYTFKVWLSNVNGMADESPIDDTLVIQTYAMGVFTTKRVLLENLTDASCGFCVDADLKVKEILANDTTAIVVNIHYDDAMAITEGIILSDEYDDIGSFTRGLIDRELFADQSSVETTIDIFDTLWTAKVMDRADEISPVKITMSNQLDLNGYNLTVDLHAQFFAPLNENYRFNCYIVEDSVTGTGAGFDQANVRDGQSGHPYENAGNPIVGFNHMRVLRYMLGGTWGNGLPNPISSPVSNGDTFSIQYNIAIDSAWDENNISIIGLVQKFNPTDSLNREILNSVEKGLTIVHSSVEAINANGISIKLYPNPVNEHAYLNYHVEQYSNVSIKVSNVLGQSVVSVIEGVDHTPGAYFTEIDTKALISGTYLLSVIVDDKAAIQEKILVIK